MRFQAIPVVRIFDEDKAKAFYLEFLGMSLDWQHRFEEGYPLYMQVSREGLVLHLSEHSGDCPPGSKIFVNTDDIEGLHRDVMSQGYRYCRPDISTAPWGDRVFEVVDPFSNKIVFNECA
jgi:uncharacterized glyoxalase superfamily protein PhnB